MVSDDSHYSGYSGLVTAIMMAKYQWLSSFPTFEKIHRPACSESLRSIKRTAKQSQTVNGARPKVHSHKENRKQSETHCSWHTPRPSSQQTSRNHDNPPPPLTRLLPTFHPKWRRLIDCWPAWPSSLQRPSPLRSDKCARLCHPCWYGAHHSWAALGRRCLERSPRHWRRKPWVVLMFLLAVSSSLGTWENYEQYVWNLQDEAWRCQHLIY